MLLIIKYSNLETIITWDYKMIDDNKATFEREFQVFYALTDGFKYCHPLTSIDSTHFYGKYKKKLLVAVAYDVNNGVYSMCFAIVEEEMNSNWSWLLDFLLSIYDLWSYQVVYYIGQTSGD